MESLAPRARSRSYSLVPFRVLPLSRTSDSFIWSRSRLALAPAPTRTYLTIRVLSYAPPDVARTGIEPVFAP